MTVMSMSWSPLRCLIRMQRLSFCLQWVTVLQEGKLLWRKERRKQKNIPTSGNVDPKQVFKGRSEVFFQVRLISEFLLPVEAFCPCASPSKVRAQTPQGGQKEWRILAHVFLWLSKNWLIYLSSVSIYLQAYYFQHVVAAEAQRAPPLTDWTPDTARCVKHCRCSSQQPMILKEVGKRRRDSNAAVGPDYKWLVAGSSPVEELSFFKYQSSLLFRRQLKETVRWARSPTDSNALGAGLMGFEISVGRMEKQRGGGCVTSCSGKMSLVPD